MSRPMLAHADYTSSPSGKSNRNPTSRRVSYGAVRRERRARLCDKDVTSASRARSRAARVCAFAPPMPQRPQRFRRCIAGKSLRRNDRRPRGVIHTRRPRGCGVGEGRRARPRLRGGAMRFPHANRGIRITAPYDAAACPPSARRQGLVHRFTAYPQAARPYEIPARRRRARPIRVATTPAAWPGPLRRAPEAGPRGRDTARP